MQLPGWAYLKYSGLFAVVLFLFLGFPERAVSADLNGLWTKTTGTDPDNRTILYQEKNEIKAIGYSKAGEKKEIWSAEGELDDHSVRLRYRYSMQALPEGWEPAGTMTLSLSDDGSTLSGRARSDSGDWSGPVAFKRIR